MGGYTRPLRPTLSGDNSAITAGEDVRTSPLASLEALKELRGKVICVPRVKLMTDSVSLNSRGRLPPRLAINRPFAD